ncbi:MAG: nitrous oxide reductase accessory protein NosL [Weeksellaceae bacterium]
MSIKSISFFVILSFILSACTIETKPIDFGNDDCDYCKMTISDTRYGAELLTKKGRDYKFDDLHCMKGFLNDEIVAEDQIHSLWIVDFSNPEQLIKAETSFLLHNDELKSPMGSNIAAFGNEEDLNKYYSEYSGKILTWKEFFNSN